MPTWSHSPVTRHLPYTPFANTEAHVAQTNNPATHAQPILPRTLLSLYNINKQTSKRLRSKQKVVNTRRKRHITERIEHSTDSLPVHHHHCDVHIKRVMKATYITALIK